MDKQEQQVPPPYPVGGPGYPPQQQPPIVVQQQPVVVQPLRDFPVQMQCPQCHQSIQTGVHYETGTITWLACLGICLLGGGLGCCLIPFCVNGLQDAVHSCPNCHHAVGKFNRM